MFIPLNIRLGAGESSHSLFDRSFELTARQFSAFSREAGNMTVPLSRIGEDLHVQMEAAFATQGATGMTGRWKPLSPAYGAWKARRSSAPILVGLRPASMKGARPQTYRVSGRMMRQLLVPLSDRATWHITPQRLLYAPLSDIAGFHQTGTGKMPARPPVDPNAAFLHSIDRTFVAWVGALVDAAGL